jgi:hypothetical protein
MDCRAVMAVMVDKRMKDAAKVQEALTKNGCIINVRLGLHEIRNVCADEGLILLYLCGAKKAIAALKSDLRKVKGVKVKTMEL